MFTAFTGTPGAGKTINLLEYVDTDKQYQNREIYYYGINECRMEGWIELSEAELHVWFDHIPDGSVLVVDEAQEHWRAGIPTKDIPLHLTKLERHRHRGIDVVITCQSMYQLHRMAKVLIDHHKHYVRPHGAEKYQCLTYTEAKDNPLAATHVKSAIKSDGKFNKKYFDCYTSAQVHTYTDRFPKKYKIMLYACFILTPLIIFGVYKFVVSKVVTTSSDEEPTSSQSSTGSLGTVLSGTPVKSRSESEPLTLADLVYLTTPLVKNDPKTAPMYLGNLRDPKDYPREQCIMMNEGPRAGLCRCYSQQNTRMRNVDSQTCKHIIFEGRTFDPQIEPRSDSENEFARKDDRTTERTNFSYPMSVQTEAQKIVPVNYPDRVEHPRNRFKNG